MQKQTITRLFLFILLEGIALWVSRLLFRELWLVGAVGFAMIFFGINNVLTKQARFGMTSKLHVTGKKAMFIGGLRVFNGLVILAAVWFVSYILLK